MPDFCIEWYQYWINIILVVAVFLFFSGEILPFFNKEIGEIWEKK